MLYLRIHNGDLVSQVRSLEDYFREGGVSIIQAAFAHSYFVHPDAVRAKTPYFPERARCSREHYPGLEKGRQAIWPGDGREVWLDDNQHAQMAWDKVYRARSCARHRLFCASYLGEPMEPRSLHGGLELVLHAVLGRNADRNAAPAPGTGTGYTTSFMGSLLSE